MKIIALRNSILRVLILFAVFVVSLNFVFSQNSNEKIKVIREHFKWINTQKDFEIIKISGEDYLNKIPDNGVEVKGFLKDNKIYKITEWIGLSSGVCETEYYFWNNQLFFIFYKESKYGEKKSKNGDYFEPDYTKLIPYYELRLYLNRDKVIKKLEKGKTNLEKVDANKFVKNANTLKELVLNKKKYLKTYKMLEGKWQSTEDILFVIEIESLHRTEYYENEVTDEATIRFDGKYLYFKSKEEGETYKYEILKLTNDYLELLYLPSGKILKFRKKTN